MTIRTNTTDKQVDTTSLLNHLLVVLALSLQIRGITIQNMDILLWTVDVVEQVLSVMQRSREACVDYMMPIGLHHIFAFDEHYGPEPDGYNAHVPYEWCPVYYHQANKDSIGFDRTHTGSNATAQYREPYCTLYDNINTCPERYLLWFHRVPWSYRLKSGRTVLEEMDYRYTRGVSEVEDFVRIWNEAKPYIDQQRWQEVDARLQHQLDNAKQWRKTCLDYFGSFTSK